MAKTTLKKFLKGKVPLMIESPWGWLMMRPAGIRTIWVDTASNLMWAADTLDDGVTITYCLD